MEKVNTFLIGAPKCGTTTLSHMLNAHSKVRLSSPKEPMYFSDDLALHPMQLTPDEYFLQYFENHTDSKIYLDASALYLFSSNAVRNIYDYNPAAKLIILLRNPIHQVHAFHSELVKNGTENVQDFEKAWNLMGNRKKRIDIPKNAREAALLQYDTMIQYADQLERVYKYFPKQQVKVYIFEKFFMEQEQHMHDVLDFLGLNFEEATLKIERLNPNATPRNLLINNYINGRFARHKLLNATKRFLGIQKFGIQTFINKLNHHQHKRDDLSLELTKSIELSFANQIMPLQKLLDDDIIKLWQLKTNI